MDLEKIRKHMADRDFLGIDPGEGYKDRVYMALADDVPDLVAEVERLQLQVGELTSDLVIIDMMLREPKMDGSNTKKAAEIAKKYRGLPFNANVKSKGQTTA